MRDHIATLRRVIPHRDELPALLTPVPGPRSRELAARLARVESRNVTCLAPAPIFWQAARGANVWDVDGNRYVDLGAAFGVANVGHAHPRVVRAVAEQAGELVHGMGDVSLRPLAKALGTSPNRLVHHFGSKEELLVAALARATAIQEGVRERWLARSPGLSQSDQLRRWWKWMNASPANLALVRLGLEAASLEATATGLPGDVRAEQIGLWRSHIEQRLLQHGFSPRDASIEASSGLLSRGSSVISIDPQVTQRTSGRSVQPSAVTSAISSPEPSPAQTRHTSSRRTPSHLICDVDMPVPLQGPAVRPLSAAPRVAVGQRSSCPPDDRAWRAQAV